MADLNEWKQATLKKIDEAAERIAELDKRRFAAEEKDEKWKAKDLKQRIDEELLSAALAGLSMFLAMERGVDPGVFALLLSSGRVADALALKAPEKKKQERNLDDMVYCTSFCNHGHNMVTGKPVGHECYVLSPSALRVERLGNVKRATELLEAYFKRYGRRIHRGG